MGAVGGFCPERIIVFFCQIESFPSGKNKKFLQEESHPWIMVRSCHNSEALSRPQQSASAHQHSSSTIYRRMPPSHWTSDLRPDLRQTLIFRSDRSGLTSRWESSGNQNNFTAPVLQVDPGWLLVNTAVYVTAV